MLKVRPVLDRLIIKQDAAEDKIGVFELAETAKERPRQGVVVAVGQGAIGSDGKRIEMMCKVGDIVQYGEFSGNPVVIDGEDYIVLREGELFFVK